MTMLAETRRLTMAPSSNLQQSTDVAWAYLLHGHQHIVCLGSPSSEALEVLRSLAGMVTVLEPGDTSDLPIDWLVEGLVVASHDKDWVMAVFASVRPHLHEDAVIVQLPQSASVPDPFQWIVLRRVSPSVFGRRLRQVQRLVAAKLSATLRIQIPNLSRRHASDVPFVSVPDDQLDQPDATAVSVSLGSRPLPRYLVELGAEHGVVFRQNSWSFGPPRGFASQKVVFRLKQHNGRPDAVVKFTQDPRFNERLGAEARAIRALSDLGDIRFALPALMFETVYAQRTVVCQTKIDGSPFRQIANRSASGAAASAGFQAVINLSAVTAKQPISGTSSHAWRALIEDFVDIYQPPADVSSILEAAVERVIEMDLPTVFMHGDFGVWNLLIDSEGKIGVLDWENADNEGAPLWDLFVFTRTLGVFLADASGTRYTPTVFAEQLLGESHLRDTLFDQIRRYRLAVDIPTEAVDDLFVLCWVQQAVRDAASHASPAWLASRSTQILHQSLQTRLEFRG